MRRLAGAALLMGLLLPAAVAASQEGLRIDDVDTTGHPTVTMVVTAPSSLAGRDASGGFVVEENGKVRPASAEALASEALEVMLMVDTSGSMRGIPLQSAVDAARRFVDRMPSTTRIGVIGFGSAVNQVLAFTDDPVLITASFEALTATGETALYDALLAATGAFDLRHHAGRFIVLLSDGGDTISTARLEAAAAALERAGISLYAVALATPESDNAALLALTDRVVPVTDTEALTGAYDEIADELVSQYRITYESDSFGATEVRVRLTVDDIQATATVTLELPAAPPPSTTTTTATAAATTPPIEPTAADAGTVTPLTSFIGRGPGLFGSSRAFGIGLMAVFGALALFLIPAVASDTGRSRLAGGTRTSSGSLGSAVTSVSGRVESLAARILRRRGKETALNHALDSAGVALRPGEFLVLVGSISLIGLATGAILGGGVLGLVLAVTGVFTPWAILRIRTDKRRLAFADQLEGTLQLIAGSLRAGYGLLQAINTVAAESPSPTADEFRRVVMETRLGRDLIDSLGALTGRVANEDFGWIVQAIQIQRDVGGDLAELLDTITSTIRDRHQIRRQVHALSAEGRLSAFILILLPIGLAGVIMITTPGYLSVLVTTTVGRILIAISVFLMVVGGLWIRRIIRLVF